MPGSVRELARTFLSFVETRSRLAASELEEQALRLVEIAIWIACSLFLFGLALTFLSVLVVLAFWDSNRILATALLALAYLGTGAAAALIARARWRERPKFLGATLEELRKDHEQADPAP